MPAAERPLRQHRHRDEQQDAGHGDQEQRGEQARDVELKARLQDLVREARAGAAGARNELRDDRTDSLAPLWTVLIAVALLVIGWLIYRGFAAAPSPANNSPAVQNTIQTPAAPAGNAGGTPAAPAPAPAPAPAA